jgi:acyl-CoA thioesterase-1
VVLGDSLTAGLGVSPGDAYPARLQEKLERAGYEIEVVNAGVSGDTSAGGLRRLDWSLDGEAAVLIVALGGNDGLRGLPVEELKGNLGAIITTARGRGVEVLLAGMEAPPNFGQAYTDAFRSTYEELADEHDVLFVPFLLEGVAGVPELNQPDQIHPNARGAEQIADHLWPTVEAMARRVDGHLPR